MADESDDEGGIGGKKLAVGAVVLLGVALLVRVLRGGDDGSDDESPSAAEPASAGEESAASEPAASDALPVDADVESAMDDIDIVDAIYILVAALKAAREEYRQRTDDGGA